MKKLTCLLAVSIALFSACGTKVRDKPDYSSAHTLRDSLIVKTKFENENVDPLVFCCDENGDSLIIDVGEYVDEHLSYRIEYPDRIQKSEKELRFEYFILSECSDTLLTCIDHFFSDTLDAPYIDVELLKDDCILEVYTFNDRIRIKYKGDDPDTDVLMNNIVNHIHNHLESNLNYYCYEIGTHKGSPIIDIYNSTYAKFADSYAESLYGLHLAYLQAYVSNKESEKYNEMYLGEMKKINDYKLRVKKYSK